jgi:hypothetical protein
VTFFWFVIWLIANSVGGNEPLGLDPVNVWTASLIAAVAIDLNRPRAEVRRGTRGTGDSRSREAAP